MTARYTFCASEDAIPKVSRTTAAKLDRSMGELYRFAIAGLRS